MANATVEGSDRLVAVFKEINDITKDLKKQEMHLELCIYKETMCYKQENDKCLLESAKLVLLNQGIVVTAMLSLVDAIRSSRVPQTPTTPSNIGIQQ